MKKRKNLTNPEKTQEKRKKFNNYEFFSELLNSSRISTNTIEEINQNFPNFATYNLQQKKDGSGFSWRPRSQLEKDLLGFTVDTLSEPNLNFNTIQLQNDLKTKGQIARGFISQPGNTMYINSNKVYQPDIAHTIIHEGNHVIESNYPHINKTTKDFLEKRAKKSQDNKLPPGYVPNLFEGMQDIINLPPNYFKNLYKADNDIQKNEISVSNLNDPFISNALSYNFNELTAHALEAQMKKIDFAINETTNDDSRSLLKGILRGMYRQYAELGFEEKYPESSKEIKNKIAELRNRKKYENKETYLDQKGFKFNSTKHLSEQNSSEEIKSIVEELQIAGEKFYEKYKKSQLHFITRVQQEKLNRIMDQLRESPSITSFDYDEDKTKLENLRKQYNAKHGDNWPKDAIDNYDRILARTQEAENPNPDQHQLLNFDYDEDKTKLENLRKQYNDKHGDNWSQDAINNYDRILARTQEVENLNLDRYQSPPVDTNRHDNYTQERSAEHIIDQTHHRLHNYEPHHYGYSSDSASE